MDAGRVVREGALDRVGDNRVVLDLRIVIAAVEADARRTGLDGFHARHIEVAGDQAVGDAACLRTVGDVYRPAS